MRNNLEVLTLLYHFDPHYFTTVILLQSSESDN